MNSWQVLSSNMCILYGSMRVLYIYIYIHTIVLTVVHMLLYVYTWVHVYIYIYIHDTFECTHVHVLFILWRVTV